MLLLKASLDRGLPQVADRSKSTGCEDRRERGSEDEARCEGTDEIDDVGGSGDVSTKDPESLTKSARDDIDPIRDAISLSDTATFVTVESYSMDFVEEGQGVVTLCQGGEFSDGGNSPIHGVNALENNDLGTIEGESFEELLEMRGVVMAEDELIGTTEADALDKRGVVLGIRQEYDFGEDLAECLKRSGVGDVTRAEEQCQFLVMKSGKLSLEQYMKAVG